MSAPASPDPAVMAKRKMSRESRRQQLIEATIEVLARRGYASTTLTEVARTAGLSHGLVNFHFTSKENLLSETLLYLSAEYRANTQTYLAAAGPSPAEQLDALMRADFDPKVGAPTRVAAWLAFWGEAQGRPLYQDRVGGNDVKYVGQMEALCDKIIAEGRYHGNTQRIARVLRVTGEGIWLDMTTMTAPCDRVEGLATVHAVAASFFPRHFGPDGVLR